MECSIKAQSLKERERERGRLCEREKEIERGGERDSKGLFLSYFGFHVYINIEL